MLFTKTNELYCRYTVVFCAKCTALVATTTIGSQKSSLLPSPCRSRVQMVSAAALSSEVFKIASTCSPYMQNYMMFNDVDGVYTYTFEAERRASTHTIHSHTLHTHTHYTCKHTHTPHTHTHIHIHTHAHTRAHTCTCTCTHTRVHHSEVCLAHAPSLNYAHNDSTLPRRTAPLVPHDL